jgi:hypothetical protein
MGDKKDRMCCPDMSQDNRHHADAAPASNAQKDPNDWTTGDKTIMGTQTSYLKTPCEETDKSFDPDLTKADASKRIDVLQAHTNRGTRTDGGVVRSAFARR